jgi:hypothetical protein
MRLVTQTTDLRAKKYEETASNHRLAGVTGVQCCHWAPKTEIFQSH